MRNFIARILNLITVLSVVSFSSCSNPDENNLQISESMTSAEDLTYTETYAQIDVAETISDITKYDEIDISEFDCSRIILNAYSGNNLFVSYIKDNIMDIYKIDTDNKSQKLISEIEWNVMYNFLSQVVGNRYFVIMPSCNTSDKLLSTLYVYDIDTGEFYEAESFKAHNMVQYMTCIDNDKLAYLYYEADTKDRVIKIFDFSTKVSSEIYRISGSDSYSPMGLTFNDENIILALQLYNEDFETETVFREISLSGNDITSYYSNDFPLELISNIAYNNGYYIVCGYRFRATREYSTIYSSLDDNDINTIISFDADLKLPLNYSYHNDTDLYSCNKNKNFASVDISQGKLQYFDVNIPNCDYKQAAISNENNDIAVIKFSDENYSNYCLALIDNDTINQPS